VITRSNRLNNVSQSTTSNEIVIHKKKGVFKVTGDTLENLLKEKKIHIESNMEKDDYM